MTTDSLKQICHVLGGLLIMVLAFIFYENQMYQWEVLYLCLGVVFILIGVLDRYVTSVLGRFGALIFLAEAAALFYATQMQHDADDSTLMYAVDTASLGYVILAFYFLFSNKKRLRKRSRKSRSVASV